MDRRFLPSVVLVGYLFVTSLASAGALDRPNQAGDPLNPPGTPSAPKAPGASASPTATPEPTDSMHHLKGTLLDQPATAAGQKYTLVGRVLEKTEGGLIVSCHNPGTWGNKKAYGYVYLTGYPDAAQLANGSPIKCSANETGTHAVVFASGVTSTLQAFAFLSR